MTRDHIYHHPPFTFPFFFSSQMNGMVSCSSSFQSSALHTALLITYKFSPKNSSSMLKRLLLPSSSLPHFLFHHSNFPTKHSNIRFPTLFSRPFSFSSSRRRTIHSLKVLSMAETTSINPSQSHKHTNRLASEHSPYLLQHAHNPVTP